MDYRILLLVHILAGMAWVGGGIVIAATHFVARRSRDPEAVDGVMRSFRWADTWLGLGAPLLVVVSGAAMVVSGAWSFSQAWILGSIALIVVYEIVALTVGARLYRRIEDARAEGRLASEAHAQTMRAWGRMSIVLVAALIGVVGLMVFKPGL